MYTCVVYHAEDGWRWRLVARNGRIVAESGEAYSRRTDCHNMARRVNVEPWAVEVRS